MIFQDPAESLNARHSVGNLLEEPLLIHGVKQARPRRRGNVLAKMLDTVGLPKPSRLTASPSNSPVASANASALPAPFPSIRSLIVCDEPVSALDVSVQSQILNLMLDLQTQFNLSYLFIAHDLAVVKHISDRIAIMYLGKIVELGPAETIFQESDTRLHACPYFSHSGSSSQMRNATSAFFSRAMSPRRLIRLPGCAFARRSWMPCTEEQMEQPGEFKEVRPGHWVEVHPATVENYEQYA
jgi:oligopeptide transport system ATP-binding protein